MKKTLSIIFISILCLLLFAGCTAQTQQEGLGENFENTENTVKTVYPLPETLDIENLDNCTVAVSFEKGDAYVDEEGNMMMDLTVYTYDLYDMVDIASLFENDVIVRLGGEVVITEIERLNSGLININGGEENGGFSLISSDSTVYYEIGMSDAKAYYELGNVTLPVYDEFVYTDASDLDNEAKEYYAGEFLLEEIFEYNFTPYNTSVVIENGTLVAMKKVYTP